MKMLTGLDERIRVAPIGIADWLWVVACPCCPGYPGLTGGGAMGINSALGYRSAFSALARANAHVQWHRQVTFP